MAFRDALLEVEEIEQLALIDRPIMLRLRR